MNRENLAESLMTFVPSMFKKMMKDLPDFELSRQQFILLMHINKDNGKSMSYYSDKLMLSKPNLTVMADKLIAQGFIERVYDTEDRRVIILKTTKIGEEYLQDHKEKFKQKVLKRLESLNDDDIRRLHELFKEIESIFNKIDKN